MGAGLAGRPPCLLPHSQVLMGAGLAGRPPCLPQSGPYGCWVSWETSLSTTVRSSGRPPCLPHSQVLMGAVYHSQVLMGAGLAGRPPCLPHSQVLMGAGLAGRPPCLPHSQVPMRWLAGDNTHVCSETKADGK